jgi:hypothetical protein
VKSRTSIGKQKAKGFLEFFGGRLLAFETIADIYRLRKDARRLDKKMTLIQPIHDEINRLQLDNNETWKRKPLDLARLNTNSMRIKELCGRLERIK